MNKIYYDPTGGFLYGIDSDDQPKIVKTDACVMMPENIFIDSLGYIHVKDLQNKDLIIKDELGNQVSIMGPAGPTGSQGALGPAGKDGVSIKLIDSLSNLELTGQTAYIYMLTEDDYDEVLGNVEAGSLYEHNGNAWVKRGSIRGPLGIQGPQGDPMSITEIDDSDASRTDITFSDNSKLTVFNGKDGINGQNGQNGADGTSIRLVNSLSDLLAKPAQTGDSCILAENDHDPERGDMVEAGSVYEYNGNTWVYKFSIKGQKGDTGSSGEDGASGTKFIVPTNKFTDNNINNLEVFDTDLPLATLQDGDYTISVDTQTLWVWSKDGGGFTKLFTLKGEAGDNGVTPNIGENGNWWIGTEDTGVQAEGKDGENQFTEEEALTLKELPGNLTDLEARIAALEQALQNIDLSGLAVAYPIPTEE